MLLVSPRSTIPAWQGVSLAAAAAVTFVLLSAPSAGAQTRAPPTLQQPDKDRPDGNQPALPNTGESLSDRLGRSGGIIRPPDDRTPDMRIAPPADPGAGSEMPVIPPPGTPGGREAPAPK